MSIFYRLKIKLQNAYWRKTNQHNHTTIRNSFDFARVTVGRETYGDIYVLMHNNKHEVKIGNFCSIAPNVAFIVESDHNLDTLSTFPFKAITLGEGQEAVSKGDIIVEDDVWIGYGSIIMSGVHIHQGAVIAAGSVVTKDVPPYAIVGGVPAKIIKYRFDEETVKSLVNLDYSKLSKEIIKTNIKDLYKPWNQSRFNEPWVPKND